MVPSLALLEALQEPLQAINGARASSMRSKFPISSSHLSRTPLRSASDYLSLPGTKSGTARNPVLAFPAFRLLAFHSQRDIVVSE